MLDFVAVAVVAVGGTLTAIKAIDHHRSKPTVAETPDEDPYSSTLEHPHVRDVPVAADTTDPCPACGTGYDPDDVVPPGATAEHGEYRYACRLGNDRDDDLAGHTIIHR